MDNNFNNGENNIGNEFGDGTYYDNGAYEYNYGTGAEHNVSNGNAYNVDYSDEELERNTDMYNQDNTGVNLNKELNGNNDNYDFDPFFDASADNGSDAGHICAVISLICGIGGFVFLCIPCGYVLSLILSPAAIVFGIIGLANGGSKEMSISGILCGGVVLLLFVVGMILGVSIGFMDALFN